MSVEINVHETSDPPKRLATVLLDMLPPVGASLLFVDIEGRAGSWTVDAIQISPTMPGSMKAQAHARGERVQLGIVDLLVTRDED